MNELQVETVINEQVVQLDIIIKGTNDYLVHAPGLYNDMIVQKITADPYAIHFFKTYIIAGMRVNSIAITNEQYKQINAMEQSMKQMADDDNQKRRDAIISGKTKFHIPYHNGKAISGHILFGLEAELLRELGVAIKFGGWRTKADDGLIEALGEDFTYEQAAAYAKSQSEIKEKEQKVQTDKMKEKIQEAKQTGKKIVIRKWQDECNDPNKLCDLDNMITYALPDGTTETTRKHTGLMMN